MRAPWIVCAVLVSAMTAVAADQPTLPQFVDVTDGAGIGFVHFHRRRQAVEHR